MGSNWEQLWPAPSCALWVITHNISCAMHGNCGVLKELFWQALPNEMTFDLAPDLAVAVWLQPEHLSWQAGNCSQTTVTPSLQLPQPPQTSL